MSYESLKRSIKNSESDTLNRVGIKKVNTIKKDINSKKEKLKDKKVANSTLDYIFGKTDNNPLK